MDVTDEEAGAVGEEVLGATPTGITSAVIRTSAETVLILSSNSADSVTVSVCTKNAENRVVTRANKAKKSSSGLREVGQV